MRSEARPHSPSLFRQKNVALGDSHSYAMEKRTEPAIELPGVRRRAKIMDINVGRCHQHFLILTDSLNLSESDLDVSESLRRKRSDKCLCHLTKRRLMSQRII